MSKYLSVILTGVATYLPFALHILPPPYSAALAAVIAAASAVYHLFQPVPR